MFIVVMIFVALAAWLVIRMNMGDPAVNAAETENKIQELKARTAVAKTAESLANAQRSNTEVKRQAEEDGYLTMISRLRAERTLNERAAGAGMTPEAFERMEEGQRILEAEIIKMKLEAELEVQKVKELAEHKVRLGFEVKERQQLGGMDEETTEDKAEGKSRKTGR